MPTPVRGVALDVDGTALTSRHRVTERLKVAVAAARSAGIEVVLTSSRAPSGLRPVARALGLESGSWFVACQGGLTGRFTGGRDIEVVDERPLSTLAAHDATFAALRLRLSVTWHVGSRWYVHRWTRLVLREQRVTGERGARRNLLQMSSQPHKVMVLAEPRDERVLRRVHDRLPGGSRGSFSHPGFLEVTSDHADKADGLAVVAHCLGVTLDDFAAIGDGRNDLGMFDAVGTAVAMGNGHPEVLAAADWVTAGNDEDGAASAIERWCPR